ncbi:hypothetical protein GCM10025772_23040 [Ferrimonas gelatinilytica]|uniref:Uncharacterized protein n=1 Tax=Ferrimonas gelatinilytica TaxID=1255257 RepID=A0ABP9SAT2_9GAMM
MKHNGVMDHSTVIQSWLSAGTPRRLRPDKGFKTISTARSPHWIDALTGDQAMGGLLSLERDTEWKDLA